jgi:hypothetical protein
MTCITKKDVPLDAIFAPGHLAVPLFPYQVTARLSRIFIADAGDEE